ncbi:hypothetical protein TW84_23560 [Vibrio neptunius]|uniref:hypothetical protein n=1 Tax=Vibrio neptunius TaxID=170651 RepID=UPI0005FA2CE0|nr:hypothetical protein [Vibrio neptunius]KJY80300.1 hypothetical protein TW84_23560 [Vibrio neptunius]
MEFDPAWKFIDNSKIVKEQFDELPSFHGAYVKKMAFHSGNCNDGGITQPSLMVVLDLPVRERNGTSYELLYYIHLEFELLGVLKASLKDFTYDNCLCFFHISQIDDSGLLTVKMDSSTNRESFECEVKCTSVTVLNCKKKDK